MCRGPALDLSLRPKKRLLRERPKLSAYIQLVSFNKHLMHDFADSRSYRLFELIDDLDRDGWAIERVVLNKMPIFLFDPNRDYCHDKSINLENQDAKLAILYFVGNAMIWPLHQAG